MTILHTRSDPQFADHLRSVPADANGQPHNVDIAVGYFYLSGFARVGDQLASRPGAVRILIGRTDRPTMAAIAAGYSPREAAAAETFANVGRNTAAQPQGDASEAGIKSLAALVAGGKVEARAYLKDRRHAKACIGCTGIPGAPGTAIIGSAGFAGNTELNYPVIRGGDVSEIRGWFERLWQEGEPVSDRAVEQIRAGWPQAVPDPYPMCLKILYELYGDALGDDAGPPAAAPV